MENIRNIVFDLGGVLVEFAPERCMETLNFSEEAKEAFRREVFPKLWEHCDLLPYEDAEIRVLFKQHLPGFEAEVDRLWDDPSSITGVKPYAYTWLSSLKAQGLKLYILSNFGKRSFEINSRLYDFLPLTDGGVISYEVQKIKPDPAIYRILCGRCQIIPEESVFLDDRPANVEAAKRLGFHGIVFTGYEDACRQLSTLLHSR